MHLCNRNTIFSTSSGIGRSYAEKAKTAGVRRAQTRRTGKMFENIWKKIDCAHLSLWRVTVAIRGVQADEAGKPYMPISTNLGTSTDAYLSKLGDRCFFVRFCFTCMQVSSNAPQTRVGKQLMLCLWTIFDMHCLLLKVDSP